MTDQGELMTRKGEMGKIGLTGIRQPATIRYNPVFFGKEKDKIVEKRDNFLRNGLESSSYEFISGGIHIWYGNIRIQEEIKTLFENTKPYIHMLFSIRSNSLYHFETLNNPAFKFSNQEHNVLILPDSKVSVELKPDSETESLSINLTPELFFSYFPDKTPLFSGFKKSLEKGVPSRLSKANLPITPRINTLLYEIVHCQLKGYSKRLLIEAKIIELLAIQIDQYGQLNDRLIGGGLKKEEVEKMHQVQLIILENPEQSFSLKDLSRQVGTNEYNLKKHFKQLFGVTVFGYIQDFRMEKAKEMLSEGNTKIAEVGRRLGYKHATHFTTAFKKYFGFLPNKIKAFFLIDFMEIDLTSFFEMI